MDCREQNLEEQTTFARLWNACTPWSIAAKISSHPISLINMADANTGAMREIAPSVTIRAPSVTDLVRCLRAYVKTISTLLFVTPEFA